MFNFKYTTISLLACALVTFAPTIKAMEESEDANQGGIAVTWGDFNKYRDVRPASEPNAVFHKRVKKSFDSFFEEYSQELPEGQSLAIEITDLDLAGDVLLGGVNEVRIMKDIYFPRMNFNYKLTDASGKVLKEGTAKIKDMNYLYNEKTWKRYKEGFYYEKRLFREWFEETILGK